MNKRSAGNWDSHLHITDCGMTHEQSKGRLIKGLALPEETLRFPIQHTKDGVQVLEASTPHM